uniref:Phage portal protein, lambda family n=1 Tax=Candidatus Kentrum sp. LFY TaxID=2126342 RepID=A0A450WRJ9_9GAMM|nr:MAG: Phage portal protein, lambda family [Candidatus Kentron sp. LFY]
MSHRSEAKSSLGDGEWGWPRTTWKRVPRETVWGRWQVLRVFEPECPGQTRHCRHPRQEQAPKNETPSRFRDINLEAAIVNAMYAAVIESEFDHAQVAEALAGW